MLREKLLAALSNEPLSLYEAMRRTGLGGWDAAQELKAMVRYGIAEVIIDSGATCYRRWRNIAPKSGTGK